MDWYCEKWRRTMAKWKRDTENMWAGNYLFEDKITVFMCYVGSIDSVGLWNMKSPRLPKHLPQKQCKTHRHSPSASRFNTLHFLGCWDARTRTSLAVYLWTLSSPRFLPAELLLIACFLFFSRALWVLWETKKSILYKQPCHGESPWDHISPSWCLIWLLIEAKTW